MSEREIGGLPVRLASVDVHTVGAGGGSLVRRDAGGAIRVGPESAGADPGPACYGRGGGATVTDATLLLGRLPAQLPRGLVHDRNPAAAALHGIDPAAVVDVVNAEMLRALRVVSVERGHDPREFALVAYGGAGPLHACALAEELGMEAVVVPAAAGVLSALGLAAGDERRDHVVSHVRPLGEVEELPPDGEADLRYRGQSFELAVELGQGLAERFHRAHEERYGYADRGREVELVAVRTAEVTPGPELELPGGEQQRASGPALVELDGSTLWIPPGWEGARDGSSWVLTRGGDVIGAPIQLQVIGASLRSIAEEMGAVLIRSSFSANGIESGATARPRCSTSAAGWSRRPSTSRFISARCPTRWRPSGSSGSGVERVAILNDPYTGGASARRDARLAHRPRSSRSLALITQTSGGIEPASLPTFSCTPSARRA